ncbi:hypothetical protein PLICRDRAFT_175305 [Plicaturopsis crispa FD-325 SS-3]|nr:hypothetical protein PLICRDRAFT_175305 [Plicaturopsis crispa FD-325 SS-3]
MSYLARESNVGLDLTNKVAVVVGGTQGIGAAVAERFAAAGALVYIVGRKADLGAAVVQQLKTVGPKDATYEFIKADLSLVREVKDVVRQIQAKTGGPPNGTFNLTSEGHEAQFAVQCLSRFGIAYLLAKSGTLKESVVNVCSRSGRPDVPDVDDLEMKKAHAEGRYGILAATIRNGYVSDAYTAQIAIEFPHLRACHIFPGIVTTAAMENQGFPYLVVLIYNIISPIISRTIGNSPAAYAEIPVYIAANPKSRDQGLEFSNGKLQPSPKSAWMIAQPELCKQIWDKLVDMLE